MTTLARRVGHLERIEEETRRGPMRARIHRIVDRLGGTLPPAEVEILVTRYASVPERIRWWRHEGLSGDQIEARLLEGA